MYGRAYLVKSPQYSSEYVSWLRSMLYILGLLLFTDTLKNILSEQILTGTA